MGLLLGTLAWLAGTVQFALTFQQLRRANPTEKIPLLFGRPRNHPGEIYAYRAIGLFLLMLAFFAFIDLLGPWVVLLVLIGSIPAVILNIQHNRRVQGGPSPTTRKSPA